MNNRKQALLSYIEDKASLLSLRELRNISSRLMARIDPKERFTFNARTNTADICATVVGTQYEGRGARIENVATAMPLQLVREPNNVYDRNAISVRNLQGESLGNLSDELADVLSPLLDNGEAQLQNIQADYVEPLSRCSGKEKKALLYVSFSVKLQKQEPPKESGCTVCLLGGEQGNDFMKKMQAVMGSAATFTHRTWAQELRVLYCKMGLSQAKLIFELYNRYCNEYDESYNETGYFGLDNLEDEVLSARQKMRSEKNPDLDYSAPPDRTKSLLKFALEQIEKEPERYGAVKDAFASVSDDDYKPLQRIFEKDSLEEEAYYWIDQTSVSKQEFNKLSVNGFSHWYEVAELYAPGKLPFDLTDEDTTGIFGTDKFAAFADLSYGC